LNIDERPDAVLGLNLMNELYFIVFDLKHPQVFVFAADDKFIMV